MARKVWRIWRDDPDAFFHDKKFRSKAQAVAAAPGIFGLSRGDKFNVGFEATYVPSIDAETLLEQLACDVADIIGSGSDWPDDLLTNESRAALSDRLTATLREWMKEYGVDPPVYGNGMATITVV